MLTGKNIVVALAVLTTGLSAGLFYAYSVSVNPAFAKLPDAEYVAAMQAVNEVIENPVFFFSFMGAAIFLPLAAFIHRSEWRYKRFKLLVAATLFYLIGTFGVTVVANVPMNEKLAEFSISSSTPQQIAAARAGFAGSWNNWHTIRTVAAVASFTAAVGASLSVFERSNKVNKKENL